MFFPKRNEENLKGNLRMSKFINFSTAQTNPDLKTIEDVEPEEVNGKLGQLTLIDVRTREEYTGELGHIPGSTLVTLDRLTDEIHHFNKNQTLVFVCRSGGRSAKATFLAKDMGFQSVYNLKGGMLLWNELGLNREGPPFQ